MNDRDRRRNFGIAAHIDAGKTTVSERILFFTGEIHKTGDIDLGNTTMDFNPDEMAKGITINSAATTCHWNRSGARYTLNLIDTPGHVDFTIEVERSLRVLDGAVAVFDGKEGVEAQSETVWRQADRYGVPRICFINKMDKLGADFANSFRSIRERLGVNAVAVQLPIGSGATFEGVIDLVELKAIHFLSSKQAVGNNAGQFVVREIAPEMLGEAQKWRATMIDSCAEFDPQAMEKYLKGEELSVDDIRRALRAGVLARRLFPVFCGAALRDIGVQPLLDGIVDYLPAPTEMPEVQGTDVRDKSKKLTRAHDPSAPFCGLVFKVVAGKYGDQVFCRIYSGSLRNGERVLNAARGKREIVSRILEMHANVEHPRETCAAGDIVALVGPKASITGDTLCDEEHPIVLERMEFPEPVISLAIEPESSEDKERLGTALATIRREDPSFRSHFDEETGQTIIEGMGELHLEIITTRIKRDRKIAIRLGRPRVAFKEAISKKAEARGLHKKQTGGHGQFGDCTITLEPFTAAQAEQEGLDFEDHFAFENKIIGGAIPREFVPSVEKGCRNAAKTGVLAGFPLLNVKVSLIDGSVHNVDSSAPAFEIAGGIAFRAAAREAGLHLLEPIMKIVVTTPEEFMGGVTGDLSRRRAVIIDSEQRGQTRLITAEAPLSEMFEYATPLRGMSQGRASYVMEPLTYRAAPASVVKTVLEVTAKTRIGAAH